MFTLTADIPLVFLRGTFLTAEFYSASFSFKMMMIMMMTTMIDDKTVLAWLLVFEAYGPFVEFHWQLFPPSLVLSILDAVVVVANNTPIIGSQRAQLMLLLDIPLYGTYTTYV